MTASIGISPASSAPPRAIPTESPFSSWIGSLFTPPASAAAADSQAEPERLSSLPRHGILWGAAATASVGAFAAYIAQKKREEEEAAARRQETTRQRRMTPEERKAQELKSAIAAVTAKERQDWESERKKKIANETGYAALKGVEQQQYVKQRLDEIRQDEAEWRAEQKRKEQARLESELESLEQADVSEAERWEAYTQSPEYQQREQERLALLNWILTGKNPPAGMEDVSEAERLEMYQKTHAYQFRQEQMAEWEAEQESDIKSELIYGPAPACRAGENKEPNWFQEVWNAWTGNEPLREGVKDNIGLAGSVSADFNARFVSTMSTIDHPEKLRNLKDVEIFGNDPDGAKTFWSWAFRHDALNKYRSANPIDTFRTDRYVIGQGGGVKGLWNKVDGVGGVGDAAQLVGYTAYAATGDSTWKGVGDWGQVISSPVAVKTVKDNFPKAVGVVRNVAVGRKVLDEAAWIAAKSTTAGKVLSFFRVLGGVLSIATGIPTAVLGGMKVYESLQDGQWDQNSTIGLLDTLAGAAATIGGIALFIPGGQPVAAVALGVSALVSVASLAVEHGPTIAEWAQAQFPTSPSPVAHPPIPPGVATPGPVTQTATPIPPATEPPALTSTFSVTETPSPVATITPSPMQNP